MRRVTVLFDDESLYRELKAEAAKEGRPVKDVVAEALSDWLRRRTELSPDAKQRRQRALQLSEELLSGQPIRRSIDETLEQLRAERS